MRDTTTRRDRAKLASPVSATIFSGVVGREHPPGDPLRYGTREEHRDATETESIARQLPGTAVYLGHPDVPARKTSAKPIGAVVEGRMDGRSIVASIAIYDREALAQIQASKSEVELSLGYLADLDAQNYQRNIKLDHLAVLLLDGRTGGARCGRDCRIERGHDARADEREIADRQRQYLAYRWTETETRTECGCEDENL
jgi:hypothetical protein